MVQPASKRPRTRRSAEIVRLSPDNPLAEAIGDLAAAVREHTEQRAAADKFVGGLGDRLDIGCAFFKRWWPRILFSAPLIAMAVGAITPEMAERLGQILKNLGLG